MNVSNTKVISNYSNALFASIKDQQRVVVVKQLYELNALIMQDKRVWNLLCSPAVNKTIKIEILKRILHSLNASVEVVNFIVLIVDHSRIKYLSEVVEAYEKLCLDQDGIKSVIVTSSKELSKNAQDWTTDFIERHLNTKVRAIFKTNQKIIAGLVLQYDSTRIDLSVLGGLNLIKHNIL